MVEASPTSGPREPQRSAFQRGYTKGWGKASRAFRRRYPLCGMRPLHEPPVMSRCYDEGRQTMATLTDHIRPHRGDPIAFWDPKNWQSLCATCHGRKTKAGL